MSQQEPTEKKKRSNVKRWVKRLLLLVLVVGLGPYLYFRATSFERKIQIHAISENVVPNMPVFKKKLTVATWNIAHGRGATDDNWAEAGRDKSKRVKEIAQFIREMEVDLVVLNEVDFSATWSGGEDQAKAIAKEAGYPYYLKQSNLDFGFIYGRWHFGNVLLSRYPIRDAEVVDFAPLNQWEDWLVGCKRGFVCDVDLKKDRVVSVIGLHLESRGENIRVKQALDVAMEIKTNSAVAGTALLAAGDFNTTPSNAPHSSTDANGQNAFEIFQSASELSYSQLKGPNPDELTYPSINPRSVIDWIFYSGGWFEAGVQKVIPTELSDHLPVKLELLFQY